MDILVYQHDKEAFQCCLSPFFQDLERVRNLAYMVNRREKLSRSFVKLREQILEKQLSLVADDSPENSMTLMELSAVIEANHGPTVYDK